MGVISLELNHETPQRAHVNLSTSNRLFSETLRLIEFNRLHPVRRRLWTLRLPEKDVGTRSSPIFSPH